MSYHLVKDQPGKMHSTITPNGDVALSFTWKDIPGLRINYTVPCEGMRPIVEGWCQQMGYTLTTKEANAGQPPSHP